MPATTIVLGSITRVDKKRGRGGPRCHRARSRPLQFELGLPVSHDPDDVHPGRRVGDGAELGVVVAYGLDHQAAPPQASIPMVNRALLAAAAVARCGACRARNPFR